MKNSTILKYLSKYFIAAIISYYLLVFAAYAGSAKNDLANLMGLTIAFGTFVGWFFLLKADVKKLSNRINN
jgi:hypothetical protein